MHLAVARGVAAAVVAGGHAHGDAERGRVGHRRVHRRPPLRGPGVFGLAPADRDGDGRRAGLRGLGDRVDEALVAVRREVHHLRRAGRGRADDVDVQRDLHVGPGRIRTRRVGPPVHADRGDRGNRDAQAAEVGIKIAGGEAAAELDDRDRLAGAGGPGRELVDVGHLVRRVRGARDRGGGGANAEMRLSLRPGIEAEDGEQDAVQGGRHEQRAHAIAVRDHPATRTRAADLLQRGAERAGQLAEGAGYLDPAGGRIDGRDLQAQAGERLADQIHIGGVGPVPVRQFTAGQDRGPFDDLGGYIRAAPQHQRQFGPFGGVQRAGRRGGRQRRALAAR